MKTETKQHTPGAVKVAKIIMNGRKLVETPYGEKNADGIADLIDRETGAPELLEASQEMVEDYLHLAQDMDGKVDAARRKRYNAMKAAIAKAGGE